MTATGVHFAFFILRLRGRAPSASLSRRCSFHIMRLFRPLVAGTAAAPASLSLMSAPTTTDFSSSGGFIVLRELINNWMPCHGCNPARRVGRNVATDRNKTPKKNFPYQRKITMFFRSVLSFDSLGFYVLKFGDI